jgi:hypothetical protein
MKKYGSNKKALPCKVCNETVENVGIESIAITCYKCTSNQLRGFGTIDTNEKNLDITISDELDQID